MPVMILDFTFDYKHRRQDLLQQGAAAVLIWDLSGHCQIVDAPIVAHWQVYSEP